MQVNDEVAHERVVDRFLSSGLPRGVSVRVIRINADDIEMSEISKCYTVE